MSYYQDDWLTVLHGDVRDKLRELPDESVHTVVTSPPYWGLRDYGTASWEGGDPECDHRGPPMRTNNKPSDSSATFHGGSNRSTEPWKDGICGKCGATRIDSQLGLEPTPEEYVANMVDVFREVRRVLRSDGTVWLNLGDSYAGGGYANHEIGGPGSRKNIGGDTRRTRRHALIRANPGLKPKDLVGIPWRVAFALQADGWYLRSDIIWSKPNPMPESVTDRPTKSHEYIFLLAKSARYYFDADAVRETALQPEGIPRLTGQHKADANGFTTNGHGPSTLGTNQGATGRNIRSVWTVATAPYPGAHFATFPPKLIEPCIKAGTSEKGVCPECGAPWRRVVEQRPYPAELANAKKAHGGIGNNLGGQRHQDWLDANPKQTTGWEPSCLHGSNEEGDTPSVSPVSRSGSVLATRKPSTTSEYGFSPSSLDPIPATVLDPFAGSGTTGMVAQSLSRRAVLIDLNVDYLAQLMDRNRDIPLGLDVA